MHCQHPLEMIKKWLNLKYVSIDKEMDDIICRSNGTDK